MAAEEGQDEALAAAVRRIERHADFRLLRRFVPRDEFEAPSGGDVVRAAVLDTETTGIDTSADRVIELGLVVFEHDAVSGTVHRVVEVYEGLEDPGRAIPPESTAIHGITDAMVRGQRLDEGRIGRMLEGVRVVIAHNARFDRPFLERRLARFEALPWACSQTQVPWEEEGFVGAKLQYLAWQQGFFFEGHRAEIDCRALLEVLRRPLPTSGVPALRRLLDQAAVPELRLWALGSPYEMKEKLKARGYRWDGERRCWHGTVGYEAAKAEVTWLKAEVYGGQAAEIEVERLDALNRFSGRGGEKRKRKI